MKKQFFFTTLLFFTMITSEIFSQVEITKSNTSYSYEDNIVNLCFYEIRNTSDTTVFLWFDREKDDRIPLPVRTHNYLLMSKANNALSFYNLVSELNIGTARAPNGIIPCVGFSFIKELKKNQSFTVILKNQSIDNFSEDFIEIIPYSTFEEINKPLGMKWFESVEYKENFIVF